MRGHAVIVAVLFVLAPPRLSRAGEAHVPRDYPTIQAAIDAGATPIYVTPGEYDESLVVGRSPFLKDSVAILPEGSAPDTAANANVIVDSMYVSMPGRTGLHVLGLRFRREVNASGYSCAADTLLFDRCTFEHGFVAYYPCDGSNAWMLVHDCLCFGDLTVAYDYFVIDGCTVVGGTLGAYNGDEDYGAVGGCRVIGPANVGIASGHAGVGGCVVSGVFDGIDAYGGSVCGCSVTHCVHGIDVVSGYVCGNIIADIDGDGVALEASYDGPSEVQNNSIRRCSGNGIHGLPGRETTFAIGNVIDSVAACGILMESGGAAVNDTVRWSGSYGIVLNGDCLNNVVLHAGRDGIQGGNPVTGNVVGHSYGNGIVTMVGSNNTSYLNRLNGFVFSGHPPYREEPDSIANNIAYGNAGYGVVVLGDSLIGLGCNDWRGNALGSTSGVAPGITDVSVEPYFCDIGNDVMSLHADTPLRFADCGTIGALGIDCDALGVAPHVPRADSEPTLGAPAPCPMTERTSIDFALPKACDVRVLVVDVAGRLVATLASARFTPGIHTVHWSPDRTCRAGVYFIRLEAGETQSVRSVALLR